jgi:hypothetical protein
MPSSLTADMAREGLRPLLERTKQPHGLTRLEAKEVLDNALFSVLILEGLWNYAKELVARGVERGTLLAAITDLEDLIGRCLAAFERVMSESKALGMGMDEVAALDQAIHAAERMQDVVTHQLRWLGDPLPAIDPASIPAVAGDAKVEGFIDLDEFAARLRS